MRNLKMVVLGVLLFGIIGGTAFAQRVPLTIRASEGPAQVILSGRMIGMANPQLRVQIAPGTYDLLVRKPGLPAFRRKINVGSSGLTVQATLGATAKSSPPPPPPEPEPEPKPTHTQSQKPAPIPAQQEVARPSGEGMPVRFYWHSADTADIYINGRPIKNFNPNYETRRDEAPLEPFELEWTIKNGDIITVGTRRGGIYGFMMVAVNRAGKVVMKTDRNWQWYEPSTENVWFQPEAYQRSNNRRTVGVNSSPWGNQNDLLAQFGSDLKAIYSPDSDDRTAHLYYKVSLSDSVGSSPAANEKRNSRASRGNVDISSPRGDIRKLTWREVGSGGFNRQKVDNFEMSVRDRGEIYVGASSDRVPKHFSWKGRSWSTDTPPERIGDSVMNFRYVTESVGGTLYGLYPSQKRGSNDQEIILVEKSGSQWRESARFSMPAKYMVDRMSYLESDAQGRIYVAVSYSTYYGFDNAGHSRTVLVSDGRNISQIGIPRGVGDKTTNASREFHIAFTVADDGTPYIARRGDNDRSVLIEYYNGSSWTNLPPIKANLKLEQNYITMDTLSDGRPVIAILESGGASVYELDSSNNWKRIGSTLKQARNNAFVAINSEDTIHLGYNNKGAYVSVWNGSKWLESIVGDQDMRARSYLHLRFDSSGSPYAIYNYNNSDLMVFRGE